MKMKKSLVQILIIVVAGIVLGGCTRNEWMLMVCSSSHSSGGCDDISYELRGYKSQRECVEKGIGLKNPAGFECGKGCKESDDGFKVCKEICNEKGCS